MKRLSALAVFVLFFLFFRGPFCAAQTQTGNASYNPSKTGLHISHPSLSFNTRVRVTNLRNNRSVEAIVNGRIPISPDRIADISGEAGDALGMAQSGMTQVEIEVVPFTQGVSAPAASAAPSVAAAETQAPSPAAPAPVPVPPSAASPVPVPAPVPAQGVTTLTEVQYVPVPQAYPAQISCGTSPLIVVLLALILLTLLIFILLLVLFWRRFPFWPWRYPLWIRRHVFFSKNRRR
jgi:hypothetical protein